MPRRLAHSAQHSSTQTDEISWLARGRRPIANGVNLIKPPFDCVAVLVRKKLAGQFDRNGMLLADVSHIGRALYYDCLRGDGRHSDRIAPFLFHRRVKTLDFLKRHLFEFTKTGSHIIISEIAKKHPIGRKISWRERNEDIFDADLASNSGGMQRTSAAVHDHQETACI